MNIWESSPLMIWIKSKPCWECKVIDCCDVSPCLVYSEWLYSKPEVKKMKHNMPYSEWLEEYRQAYWDRFEITVPETDYLEAMYEAGHTPIETFDNDFQEN